MQVTLHAGSVIVKRRRGSERVVRGEDAPMPAQFLASGVTVDEVIEVAPTAGARRGSGRPAIELSVVPDPGKACVIAARHPSGAITFHFGEPPVGAGARRGGRAAPAGALRFRILTRGEDEAPEAAAPARRGFIGRIVKLVVLEIASAVVDAVLPRLVLAFEKRSWAKRGLSEGWFRVDAPSLASGKLVAAKPGGAGAGRSLLFIHGTFSHAASAFGPLGSTNFFARVAPLYGDRTYAFNHFTLARTPEENARSLLAGLPPGVSTFDVVTHSRGGLVLRNLVERRGALGAAAGRFELGHAVLVASPNDGTPLATPERWENTLGWFANLLEALPANPLTTAAEWIAESIVWLARRVSGGFPGIHAMDTRGDLVAALQRPPGPPAGAYSALVANFHPTGGLGQRLLDVGIDGFFGAANDLVVPSEGGWRVDREGAAHLAAERVGCFGAGGNLGAAGVHHMNFFEQPETADFLVRALSRQPQPLPAIDLDRPLPDRRFRGAGAAGAGPAARPAGPARLAPAGVAPGAAPAAVSAAFSDAFHLMVLPPPVVPAADPARPLPAQLLAMYRGARVLQPFPTKGGEAGRKFQAIIAMNERIRKYVTDGSAKIPVDDELLQFGELLFDTLFPPEIRRLYDVARSDERATRLDVIFTSMIPWIADKPWEFAFDRARGAFLATEEIQFVRNVLTGVPAQIIPPLAGKLRILVVVAQPIGLAQLSSADEEAVIRRGFEPLIEAGLVEVEVLTKATPASLHGYIDTGRYDIVHFIGHGEFADGHGYLVFEDDGGAPARVDDRSLREIFCHRSLRLVFLNACETGQGGRIDFNRGVAPALVAGGVPIVVANQYKVLDVSATTFAQHLYWCLAQGMTIGKAARESRIALNYSLVGEAIDWAVPVVYARDPMARLCAVPPAGAAPAVAPQIAPSARRSTAAHHRRVAVWDVDHIFPQLEATLARLSAAQDRFGFMLVDLSAPLGTWQVAGEEAAGRATFFHADRAARRLQNKAAELRVDALVCITRRPMREGRTKVAAWQRPESPVVIFSTDGVPVPASGAETERAIASVLVGALARRVPVVKTHGGPHRQCPLFFDPSRPYDHLVRRQKFDPKCRRLLRKNAPDDLPALEKLLEVFHGENAE